jgi:hypothetical protein
MEDNDAETCFFKLGLSDYYKSSRNLKFERKAALFAFIWETG